MIFRKWKIPTGRGLHEYILFKSLFPLHFLARELLKKDFISLKKVFEMWSDLNAIHTCLRLNGGLIKYSLRETVILGSVWVFMQTSALFLLDTINTISTSSLPNAVTSS